MINRTWTPVIRDLVETLTCRVRVLSMVHVHHGWSELLGSSNIVLETLERLVKAGLIHGAVRCLPPCPIDDEPLCRWNPGESQPNLVSLADAIHNRWNAKPEPTLIVAATDKAARLFGSTAGGLPPANHCNHDLLLAEVYMRYRLDEPETAKRWLGEDAVAIAERGVKNPDAFLFDADGAVIRVVESAGRYSLDQLESFHRHCQLEELPYELW